MRPSVFVQERARYDVPVAGIDPQLEARIGEALDTGDIREAATRAVRGYGPQILGYLMAVVRERDLADDAFSIFTEDLWKGLEGFRRGSSFRTWAYKLAYHAALRVLRDPNHRRGVTLPTSMASDLAAQVRSETPMHLRTDAKTSVQRLREELTPEEQTLLVLRVDRRLEWREVAYVMGGDAEEPALRKRFERLREKLKKLALERGILDSE
jgi:RNA polymerase sigma-70 factor (ECF subfamily)